MKLIRSLAVAAALGLASLGMAGKAEACSVDTASSIATGCGTVEDFWAVFSVDAALKAIYDTGVPFSITGTVSSVFDLATTSVTKVYWTFSGVLNPGGVVGLFLANTYSSVTSFASSPSVEEITLVSSVQKSLGGGSSATVDVPGPLAGAGLPILALGAAYLLRRRSASTAA